MPFENACCCCISLRIGIVIIAIYTMVMVIIFGKHFNYILIILTESGIVYINYFQLILDNMYAFIHFIVSILLIMVANMDLYKPNIYILPWIILQTFKICEEIYNFKHGPFDPVFYFLRALLNLYFLFVGLNFYHEVSINERYN